MAEDTPTATTHRGALAARLWSDGLAAKNFPLTYQTRNLDLLNGAAVTNRGEQVQSSQPPGEELHTDRLARRIAAIEPTIDRYLTELDRADREHQVTGVPLPDAKIERLTWGIDTVKAKRVRLSAIEAQMALIHDELGSFEGVVTPANILEVIAACSSRTPLDLNLMHWSAMMVPGCSLER